MAKWNITKSQLRKNLTQTVGEQLVKEGETIFNRANKRIRNLSSHNEILSPALQALIKKRGDAPRFGVKNAYSNLDDYNKEIAMAQEFLNLETSTVKGARNFTKNLTSQLHTTKPLTNDFISAIFDSLHGLHERMPDMVYANVLQYKDYLDVIIETAENMDLTNLDNAEQVNSIIEKAIDKLTNELWDAGNLGDFGLIFNERLF